MLLCKDPSKRLGNGPNGAEDIKKHPFFKDIDWLKIYNREVVATYIPSSKSQKEFRYFQDQFNLLNSSSDKFDLLSEETDSPEHCDTVAMPVVEEFSFFRI